jgi:hypothetical protein
MGLIKEFRESGADKAVQDKIVRDFQSTMKKVVDPTKDTRTWHRCPPALLPGHLPLG